MTTSERIQAEQDRLNNIFKDLDANARATAAGLISSAAFLVVQLEDLQEEINTNGCVEEYVNGKDQHGWKVSAAVQAYGTLNGKYQSVMAKLLKLTPPAPKETRKSAEAVAAEAAERAEKEQRDRVYRRQQQRDADFFAALKDGTATNDSYKEFCSEWERIHADD